MSVITLRQSETQGAIFPEFREHFFYLNLNRSFLSAAHNRKKKKEEKMVIIISI